MTDQSLDQSLDQDVDQSLKSDYKLSEEDKRSIEKGKNHQKPDCKKVIKLTQANFNAGIAVTLDQPNTCYLLTEDVTFEPVSPHSAILIAASNITLNLGGHTLTAVGAYGSSGILLQLPGAALINIYIYNGAITGFAFGVRVGTTINLTLRKLKIFGISGNIAGRSAFGIFMGGSTNFLIERCKIFSLTTTTSGGVFGMRISSSAGTLRNNRVFDLHSTQGIGYGIQFLGASSPVMPIHMFHNVIFDVKSAMSTGLDMLRSGANPFDHVCIHDLCVKQIQSIVAGQAAIGVNIESSSNVSLKRVSVKNVIGDTVFGFRLPNTDVKLDECEAEGIKAIVVATAKSDVKV